MTLTHPQDSVTGLLLAGIGHVDDHQNKNFLVVDASEENSSRVYGCGYRLTPLQRHRRA